MLSPLLLAVYLHCFTQVRRPFFGHMLGVWRGCCRLSGCVVERQEPPVRLCVGETGSEHGSRLMQDLYKRWLMVCKCVRTDELVAQRADGRVVAPQVGL